jgi:hypothetical protein
MITFKLTEQFNVEFSFEEQKEIDTLAEDMAPVFVYINRKLEDGQPNQQPTIPVDESSIQGCLKSLQDGVVLS